MPPGPSGLRYLDYFLGLLAGSRVDTGAKLEIIAIISGFATMYGAMQAASATQQNGTTMADEQAAAQTQAFIRAAASGTTPTSPPPWRQPGRSAPRTTSSNRASSASSTALGLRREAYDSVTGPAEAGRTRPPAR